MILNGLSYFYNNYMIFLQLDGNDDVFQNFDTIFTRSLPE